MSEQLTPYRKALAACEAQERETAVIAKLHDVIAKLHTICPTLDDKPMKFGNGFELYFIKQHNAQHDFDYYSGSVSDGTNTVAAVTLWEPGSVPGYDVHEWTPGAWEDALLAA